MSPARAPRPGYVVTHPSRDRRSSRLTRVAVAGLLVVSAGLILLVTAGGWSKLAGLEPLNLAWAAAYLVMAASVWRWTRGPLPIAIGSAALLLAFALVAVTGVAGVAWSDRAARAYAPVRSLFGGAGLSPHLLGLLTGLIALSQALLMGAAAYGFRQRWNVEYEIPVPGAGELRT